MLQKLTSVHPAHARMVGHVLMVLGPIHVAALMGTKATSVKSVRLYFNTLVMTIILRTETLYIIIIMYM